LRVLGNFCDLAGFDHVSLDDVRSRIDYSPGNASWGYLEKRWNEIIGENIDNDIDLVRIVDMPPLRIDGAVRRAPSLQRTRQNPPPAAHVNSEQAGQLNVADGDTMQVHAGNDMTRLPVVVDERVPARCAYIPGGFSETAILGAARAVRLVRGS